jgi:DNA-directed RNA polymerase specialized sigma24 family protein
MKWPRVAEVNEVRPSPDIRAWSDRYHRDKCGCGTVFAVVTRLGTRLQEATDLMNEARQEAVARVLDYYDQNPNRFRDFDHFANTVTRTATNWLRDQRRRSRGILGVFDSELIAPIPDLRPRVVRNAMEQLAREDREIITRAVIDGASLDELAEQFLPSSTASPNARRLKIRRRLLSAIDRLRDKYTENDTE